MGELEKYGLLSVGSILVLFLILTFSGPDVPGHDRRAPQAAGGAPPTPRAKANTERRTPELRTSPQRPKDPSLRALAQGPGNPSPNSPAVDPPRLDVPHEPPSTLGGRPRAEPPRTTPSSFDPSPRQFDSGGAPLVHEVQKGDTLSGIARDYLGDAKRWRDFLAVNDHINPDRLRIGDQIVIPSASGAGRGVEPETAAVRQHEVLDGDTLSGIASRYYGDARKWKKVYEHNQARIPRPDKLPVGTILDLP